MKKLAAIALTGIGVLLVGTRSYERGLPGNLDLPIYSNNISYESKNDLEGKVEMYGSAKRDFALKDYKSYVVRFNEKEFLEEAKTIDSLRGYKYREKIDASLWEKGTGGIFDANLAYALGLKESSGNLKVEQDLTGARGFWQIMYKTWEGLTNLSFDKAFDFKTNERMAIRNLGSAIKYLESNLDFWDYLSREEKQKLVLASHNWGQGRVVKNNGDLYKAPKETRDLIQKVFTYYNYLNLGENKDLVGPQNIVIPD